MRACNLGAIRRILPDESVVGAGLAIVATRSRRSADIAAGAYRFMPLIIVAARSARTSAR
jgi:hypothetical protein